jgi:hypothetical protein
MAQSNSKLTKDQKAELREFKEVTPHALFMRAGRVTVLVLDKRVSVSIASIEEKKFRVKVGQYWAMQRMIYGETLPIALDAVFEEYEAEQLALALTNEMSNAHVVF